MSHKPVVIDPVQLVGHIYGKSVKMTGFMADHATSSWRQADLTFTSVHDRSETVIRYKNESARRVRIVKKILGVALVFAGIGLGWGANYWVSKELGLYSQPIVITQPAR